MWNLLIRSSPTNHGEGLTEKAGSKRQAGRQARLARQGKARQGKAGGKAGQAVDNQNSVRSRGLLGPIMGDASGVSLAPISAYPRRNANRPDPKSGKRVYIPTSESDQTCMEDPVGCGQGSPAVQQQTIHSVLCCALGTGLKTVGIEVPSPFHTRLKKTQSSFELYNRQQQGAQHGCATQSSRRSTCSNPYSRTMGVEGKQGVQGKLGLGGNFGMQGKEGVQATVALQVSFANSTSE